MSHATAANSNHNIAYTLTLLNTALVCVIIGFAIGGLFIAKDIIEISHLRAQISQIETFDAATATFFDKYNGLPGDLLAVRAKRLGLAAGNGTPGNSDGDGKISPCNLGWQWNLGCETALFWAQLATAELLPDEFNADSHLYDRRLDQASILTAYLPQSPMGNGTYITVWNTDVAQESPAPRLPYGNYYEISHIEGIKEGKMIDNPNALTPVEARAIDEKIDDGGALTGRVIANGNAHWPKEAWGTLASTSPENCVAPNLGYNSFEHSTANKPLCHLAVAFKCCTMQQDDY